MDIFILEWLKQGRAVGYELLNSYTSRVYPVAGNKSARHMHQQQLQNALDLWLARQYAGLR